jgi:2-oxoglutarate ferredoxin oxidoreductase subunit alpha
LSKRPIEGEQQVFMTGNEVVAWAALAAGAEIMYGYPITPQNEIMHYWTRLAPRFGRKFLQTEDELSAGFSTIGGVLAGKKAFSATSGPGTVLFQEPLSMAEMMRLPVVVVIQQRGGPSTATVIYSQQEVVLAAFGGNGEGLRIVYSTSSHQELYDYTLKAFDVAWRYRFPTFVLGDGYQAQMREALTIYDPADRNLNLQPAEPFLGGEGRPGSDRPPVHMRNAFSVEEELYDILMQIIKAYEEITPKLVEFESGLNDDAELTIIAHGIVSRSVKEAVEILRRQGVHVGYFRPITLRPFPREALCQAVQNAGSILIVESAYGQLARLTLEALGTRFIKHWETYSRPGMGITAEELVEKVNSMEFASKKLEAKS